MGLSLGACDRAAPTASQPQEKSAANKPGVQRGLDRSHAGTPLPDATIALPDGTRRALADFAGEPVLLNLWATWCAPCVVEMPLLDDLANETDGLKVLTVSQDLQGADAVEPFFAENDFAALEPWLDPDNALGFAYGQGVALPLTVLYDAQGREVWRYYGENDWSGEAARALVSEAS